jgi:hypothetical protein
MDKQDEQVCELLWRHVVDLRYGDGTGPEEGGPAVCAESIELRELTALADEVHTALQADPSAAQAAARSQFLQLLASETAPRKRAPLFSWPALRGQPALVILLVLLLAMTIAAWTYVLRTSTDSCETRPSEAPPAPSGPVQRHTAAPADGCHSIKNATLHPAPRSRSKSMSGLPLSTIFSRKEKEDVIV